MTRSGAPLALPRRRFLGRILAAFAGVALLARGRRAEAAPQSIEPYLGEIMLFAGNFPPRGWAFCNGQLLPINQNQALFSLLGTNYGGNGQTNFALPDLRDRVPIHHGQGPGLSSRVLGERAGEAAHTLLLTELPAHSHVARVSSAVGGAVDPGGMFPARNAAQIPQYGGNADTPMAAAAVSNVGGNQPHDNTQPVLALRFVIALQGVFPSP